MTPPPQAVDTVRLYSLTLRERLAGPPGAPAALSVPRGDDVVHRWRQILERSGPGRFARRLRWDGLEESGVRAALGEAPVQAPASDWSVLLAEACGAAGWELDTSDPALDPADPIAFEEVLLPFVQVARRRLGEAFPGIDRVLAPAARASLERALLDELSGIAEQALLVDFSVARVRHGIRSFSLGAPSRTGYQGFVGALRSAALEPLISRYPVLARLLSVRASFWVDASAEFLVRVQADAPALGTLFGGGTPGRIEKLQTGRGDTHCGGRTVSTVRFASGLQAMYKPRDMKLDVAFYGLLEWLRARGLEPDQRVLRLLDRGDYGWVEFVHAEPVHTETEIRDYYERAGALLCLTYLLGATDLHAENLIAAGPYPVPVDLETIMGVQVAADARTAAPGAPARSAGLLGIGLLPYWQIGSGGPRFCGGAMGLQAVGTPGVERAWSLVNTDQMCWRERTRDPAPRNNLPRLRDRSVPAPERVADLVRGFERCHAFLEARHAELASAGGPLERFRGQRARMMLRDTWIYGSAMRGSLHPRHLHDGIERSLQLELLRTSALGSDEPLSYWPAFDAEQRELDDLDYPYFWCFTDGTVLHDSRGTPVGTFCVVSPHDEMLRRLGRMDAQDRQRQAALVRFIYAFASGPVATCSGTGAAADGGPALDASAMVAEARAIAGALEALTVRDADGSAQWVGVNQGQGNPADWLGSLSDRLYDGRPGVALFLAALDAVESTGHAELAAEVLLPLRRCLRGHRQRAALAARIGIGAGFGMGGIVYALAQAGRLTNDPGCIDDARRAAGALTPGAIASDPVLEVLGGAAGAALALLSLYELTGDRWVLERAESCGARLLASAREEPVTGQRVWRPRGAGFATGFAHGAGGIGTALLRLAAVTGSDAFAAAAEQGFRFEDSFPGAHGSASDPAHAAAAACGAFSWGQTWCNGAAGVALGRAVYGAPVPARVVAEVSRWEIESSPDHACCGHLGRTELLLAAGHRDRALALAGDVVTRARSARSYQISREVPDARYAPGFFQGLSGIGYQLLRIARPGALPSVLVFQ